MRPGGSPRRRAGPAAAAPGGGSPSPSSGGSGPGTPARSCRCSRLLASSSSRCSFSIISAKSFEQCKSFFSRRSLRTWRDRLKRVQTRSALPASQGDLGEDGGHAGGAEVNVLVAVLGHGVHGGVQRLLHLGCRHGLSTASWSSDLPRLASTLTTRPRPLARPVQQGASLLHLQADVVQASQEELGRMGRVGRVGMVGRGWEGWGGAVMRGASLTLTWSVM
jgi:hypothetical protein